MKSFLTILSPLIYKGGEDPPMFAKMHLVNWPSKLSDYANLLIDDCVEDYNPSPLSRCLVLDVTPITFKDSTMTFAGNFAYAP